MRSQDFSLVSHLERVCGTQQTFFTLEQYRSEACLRARKLVDCTALTLWMFRPSLAQTKWAPSLISGSMTSLEKAEYTKQGPVMSAIFSNLADWITSLLTNLGGWSGEATLETYCWWQKVCLVAYWASGSSVCFTQATNYLTVNFSSCKEINPWSSCAFFQFEFEAGWMGSGSMTPGSLTSEFSADQSSISIASKP